MTDDESNLFSFPHWNSLLPSSLSSSDLDIIFSCCASTNNHDNHHNNYYHDYNDGHHNYNDDHDLKALFPPCLLVVARFRSSGKPRRRPTFFMMVMVRVTVKAMVNVMVMVMVKLIVMVMLMVMAIYKDYHFPHLIHQAQ